MSMSIARKRRRATLETVALSSQSGDPLVSRHASHPVAFQAPELSVAESALPLGNGGFCGVDVVLSTTAGARFHGSGQSPRSVEAAAKDAADALRASDPATRATEINVRGRPDTDLLSCSRCNAVRIPEARSLPQYRCRPGLRRRRGGAPRGPAHPADEPRGRALGDARGAEPARADRDRDGAPVGAGRQLPDEARPRTAHAQQGAENHSLPLRMERMRIEFISDRMQYY